MADYVHGKKEFTHVLCKFDRYGLYFPDTNTNAVMYTDSTGAATVRIAMPAHMQSSLIFHYNLKFYDNDGDGYDGVSLKRFVMQVTRDTLPQNGYGERHLFTVLRANYPLAAFV